MARRSRWKAPNWHVHPNGTLKDRLNVHGDLPLISSANEVTSEEVHHGPDDS
jgi:hypothetical protein